MTYGEWINTDHGFSEAIGFYRDGKEIAIVPNDIMEWKIYRIAKAPRHDYIAFIYFDRLQEA